MAKKTDRLQKGRSITKSMRKKGGKGNKNITMNPRGE